MDAAQLQELRQWAKRLAQTAEHAELRAAARAILMLSDEVDRLVGELEGGGGRGDPPEPPLQPKGEPEAGSQASKRRRLGFLRLAVGLAGLSALIFAAFSFGAYIAAPGLEGHGPGHDAKIGARALKQLVFWVKASPSTLAHSHWSLDGVDITSDAKLAGDRLVFDGSHLPDGEHHLRVSAHGGFPGATTVRSWTFTIDTTGAQIPLSPPGNQFETGKPIVLSGTLEPGARLSVDGRPVSLDHGRWTVRYPSLPSRPARLDAVDAYGNSSSRTVRIELVPRHPPLPVRAVHMTSYAWATPALRNSVLRLIDAGKIDAVELDLKDESGLIGFDAHDVPLGVRAHAIGAVYKLDDVVRLLHSKGVRVIGRLVAFRDPVLAKWAWRHSHRSWVIQTPRGLPYSGYGGFTNFADPAVRRYNVDIALEAARRGVDEILYDYVRRPDGPLSSMVFPGLTGTPESAIVEFLHETREALAPYKTFLGASVFGVSATRPKEVAQDIPAMARNLDYVAPMVYPSHWAPGEYGVARPNAEPYEIVVRSLQDFVKDVDGTGARVVPWLQDFSLHGVTYGPMDVRAQIDAARVDGIDEFLLWDPAVTYHAAALDANARTSTSTAAATPSTGLPPNELGLVPVIMHHEIRPDRVGPYDQTPDEFRDELEQLWLDGYVPVRAEDLLTGHLDVPAGRSPVVLTFDDSTQYQFFYLPDGEIKPTTAIGVMLDFARTHPGFRPTGTFYVLREPFAGIPQGPAMLRWLVAHGFELGDHTYDHLPLNTLDATSVQKEMVEGGEVIQRAVPGYTIRTMALPEGAMPHPASLAVRGSWNGHSYGPFGVFLAGAEPAPSPFSTRFHPAAIPRIRTSHAGWNGQRDLLASYWLDFLERNPQLRYVSDGDPIKITFPRRLLGELNPKFRAEANPR